MQTFLPYPDFRESAKVLDYRRLGKQRLEARQLVNALFYNPSSGWAKHPAAKMWKGYVGALMIYHNEMIFEWENRGYRNNMPKFVGFQIEEAGGGDQWNRRYPPWIGDSRLHLSHQSNLLRKDPEHYGKFGWTVPPDLPYFWPGEDYAPL